MPLIQLAKAQAIYRRLQRKDNIMAELNLTDFNLDRLGAGIEKLGVSIQDRTNRDSFVNATSYVIKAQNDALINNSRHFEDGVLSATDAVREHQKLLDSAIVGGAAMMRKSGATDDAINEWQGNMKINSTKSQVEFTNTILAASNKRAADSSKATANDLSQHVALGKIPWTEAMPFISGVVEKLAGNDPAAAKSLEDASHGQVMAAAYQHALSVPDGLAQLKQQIDTVRQTEAYGSNGHLESTSKAITEDKISAQRIQDEKNTINAVNADFVRIKNNNGEVEIGMDPNSAAAVGFRATRQMLIDQQNMGSDDDKNIFTGDNLYKLMVKQNPLLARQYKPEVLKIIADNQIATIRATLASPQTPAADKLNLLNLDTSGGDINERAKILNDNGIDGGVLQSNEIPVFMNAVLQAGPDNNPYQSLGRGAVSAYQQTNQNGATGKFGAKNILMFFAATNAAPNIVNQTLVGLTAEEGDKKFANSADYQKAYDDITTQLTKIGFNDANTAQNMTTAYGYYNRAGGTLSAEQWANQIAPMAKIKGTGFFNSGGHELLLPAGMTKESFLQKANDDVYMTSLLKGASTFNRPAIANDIYSALMQWEYQGGATYRVYTIDGNGNKNYMIDNKTSAPFLVDFGDKIQDDIAKK